MMRCFQLVAIGSVLFSLGLTASAQRLAQAPRPPRDFEWSDEFGLAGASDSVRALEVFDDGNGLAVYAGGSFDITGNVLSRGIARWNGARWQAVGDGTGIDFGDVYDLAVFDDGAGPRLAITGSFSSVNGIQADGIAFWDGESWSAPPGLNGGFGNKLLSAGNALYVGGDFDVAGGVAARNVARWDGAQWSSLGTGVANTVSDLVIADLGAGPALYASSLFFFNPEPALTVWNGSSWSPVPGAPVGSIRALDVYDDGGGPVLVTGGGQSPAVQTYDGTSWGTLGSGLPALVWSLRSAVLQGQPVLFAGGNFVVDGDGDLVNGFAVWDGSDWLAIGSSVPGVSAVSPGAGVHDVSLASFGPGPERLYVGGSFTRAGGNVAFYFAQWDGIEWLSAGSGHGMAADGTGTRHVRSLFLHDDGDGELLYAGGSFDFAGTAEVNGFARFTGDEWEAVGGAFPRSSQVWAMEAFDDGDGPGLYAAGRFSSAGSVAAENVARWDSGGWSPLAGGVDGPVEALRVFDDGGGPALYLGGSFDFANGAPAASVARWDGTEFVSLASGTTGTVSRLEVFDEGAGPVLFACGRFSQAGGVTTGGLARWDGASWSAVGGVLTNFGSPANVYDMLAVDLPQTGGPALVVIGSIGRAGTVPVDDAAYWDGVVWRPLGDLSGVGQWATALHVFDDGKTRHLLAAGGIGSQLAASLNRCARWSGAEWVPYAGGFTDGIVNAMVSRREGSDHVLYAGGSFYATGESSTGSALLGRYAGRFPDLAR